MTLSSIFNKAAFSRRMKQLKKYDTKAISLQCEQLNKLIHKARRTSFGQKYGFAEEGYDYEKFSNTVPLATYDEIKPWIERMLKGEKDVLWPGLCKWFAKSSGTTSDKSKYIPVTDYSLKHTHFRGGTDSVVAYLMLNPNSKMFLGKGLILGGSFSKEKGLGKGIRCGDLSASLIQNVTPAVNFIRTPNKRIALMSEWETKLKALTQSTMNVNVTSISGVPSWMMGVLKAVIKEKGAKDITEVWPNLEVFFHGGIAFGPYREEYKKLIPSSKMHYLETYNASEGFFGIQTDWNDSAMTLLVDNRIFYEFIPMEEFSEDSSKMKAIPLKDIEVGKNYAMVITTPGLWRYIIGDTVKFTQKDPYKFHITGRTKAFINAFGEEVMVSNADEAIAEACRQTNATISDYTAAPTFAEDNKKARHYWIIEFSKAPDNLESFAEILDTTLQKVNSDYEAKRYKGIFLDRLELTSAPSGTFSKWLKLKKGKLGGQIKIPRLSNSRQYYEELMAMIEDSLKQKQ